MLIAFDFCQTWGDQPIAVLMWAKSFDSSDRWLSVVLVSRALLLQASHQASSCWCFSGDRARSQDSELVTSRDAHAEGEIGRGF